MEKAITIISVLIAFVSLVYTFYRNQKLAEKDENTVMVSLKADLKYLTKQVEKIDDKLEKIELSISNTLEIQTRHEQDIKTLYKYYDRLIEDVERLKNERSIK